MVTYSTSFLSTEVLFEYVDFDTSDLDDNDYDAIENAERLHVMQKEFSN